MGLLRVQTQIDAPPGRVWDLLLDWEGSAAWMVDATTVEVLSSQREGVGTRIRAITTIARVRLRDEMAVTRWVPERLIEVKHERWPIRGIAWFELSPRGPGTWFEWGEELDPPLPPFGEGVLWVLKGQIERVLARSLCRFREIAEARQGEGRNP